MRPLPSLRLWLLSTSVLTVIAGYTLLLVLNGSINAQQRQRQHQRLVQALVFRRSEGSLGPDALPLVGLESSLLPEGDEQKPVLDLLNDGTAWLVSRVRLSEAAGGSQLLEVRQDVSDSFAQERLSQMLLIAAAGLSTLLTAVLLRLVLWRGLVRPLKDLSAELDALSADSLGDHPLAVEQLAIELQPIAEAFNNLQQRLAAAWQRERRFVDGVAHELRTPITLISGRSQRLLRQAHSDVLHQSLQQIHSEACRMAELISVLLELARSDSGRLQLSIEALDGEQQLLEAFERLRPTAPERLRLGPPPEPSLPAIHADRERLQQCLAALIDNALRYSQGPVLLRCSERRSPTDHHHAVVLHVSDSGPGIPVAERAHVLERFARGSSSAGTRGSGIGLAMVQELSQAMGAELRIADQGGGGADLQLCFPV
ncbi:HAMP domain-containing sensor histidine kinase [Synechococcus sp. HK01-R]|uniref:sensor histidine kinase n=1 Tax=Synechococcus sp. HK01-R TaxID=2751171 RepID=UPI001628CC5C|nr:HAMP domain-containing sensor histidine kinase [Synechococcus sp. HK01-R]QNG27081.1 HAMP domain-containing histidine kinase [Synechococcus sp. HK01-R]